MGAKAEAALARADAYQLELVALEKEHPNLEQRAEDARCFYEQLSQISSWAAKSTLPQSCKDALHHALGLAMVEHDKIKPVAKRWRTIYNKETSALRSWQRLAEQGK